MYSRRSFRFGSFFQRSPELRARGPPPVSRAEPRMSSALRGGSSSDSNGTSTASDVVHLSEARVFHRWQVTQSVKRLNVIFLYQLARPTLLGSPDIRKSMLKTSDFGRMNCAGLRWQLMHQFMFNVFTLYISGISFTLPVAGRAANAFVDVNAVVEIDEIRQIVHARPFDRFAARPAFADWLRDAKRWFQICEWHVMQVSVGGSPA